MRMRPRAAIDPYVQMRSADRRRRADQIREGTGASDAAFGDPPAVDRPNGFAMSPSLRAGAQNAGAFVHDAHPRRH